MRKKSNLTALAIFVNGVPLEMGDLLSEAVNGVVGSLQLLLELLPLAPTCPQYGTGTRITPYPC